MSLQKFLQRCRLFEGSIPLFAANHMRIMIMGIFFVIAICATRWLQSDYYSNADRISEAISREFELTESPYSQQAVNAADIPEVLYRCEGPRYNLEIMCFRSFPERINVNTAPVELLMVLPNIGESLAEKIVHYRSIKGHVSDVRDLERIPGITPRLTDHLAELITFGEQETEQ
ncbi:helix-hairpin-helix domain-containing protein [bacterium]|nr:helix-hairpin-helix domain-containing protein [candidate division CSSED10-310 bacterium]